MKRSILGLILIFVCGSEAWPQKRFCAKTLTSPSSVVAPAVRMAEILSQLTSASRRNQEWTKWSPIQTKLEDLLREDFFITPEISARLNEIYRSEHEVTAALFSKDGRTVTGLADVTDYSTYSEDGRYRYVALRDGGKLHAAIADFSARGEALFAIFHSRPVHDSPQISFETASSVERTVSQVSRGTLKRPFAANDPSDGDIYEFLRDWNEGLAYFMMIGTPGPDDRLQLRMMLPIASVDLGPGASVMNFRGATGASLLKIIKLRPGVQPEIRGRSRYVQFINDVSFYRRFLSVYEIKEFTRGVALSTVIYYLEVPLRAQN